MMINSSMSAILTRKATAQRREYSPLVPQTTSRFHEFTVVWEIKPLCRQRTWHRRHDHFDNSTLPFGRRL